MTLSVPIVEPSPRNSAPTQARYGRARFHGEARAFWRLVARGSLLLLVTFGIYRFWLATDVRRFLWSNTEIAGEVLEYLGTARELLLGFLVAVFVVVPICVGCFMAVLDAGRLGRMGSAASLLVLLPLGQFAVYRARRYRLTRTLFRGLRFHQSGSAWRYAACAVLWWGIIALSMGLAYPWSRAALERLKLRNTFYGNLRGRFAGSGTRLFIRALPMWLVIVAPALLSFAATIDAINWAAVADAIDRGGENVMGRIEGASPGFSSAIVYVAIAVGWSVAAAAALYPAFQATVLRWWLSGLVFGELTVTSRLSTASLYGVYVRFVRNLLGLAVTAVVVALLVALFIRMFNRLPGPDGTIEVAGTVLWIGLYVAIALGCSAIYQATVKLPVWQLGLESLEFSGLSVLDHVEAGREASSAIGEDLVDALHVGGY